jgi:hypothetical protein
MNERIEKLAIEAGLESVSDDLFYAYNENLERFAELIVEECARRCDVVRENNGGDKQFGARLCADEIRSITRRS